ncbi:MAG TPA: hypothetical protein VFQ39_04635 [Longimicrobium sp.]|nr:hypothetical protein [Longimicrobium sp.]
MKKTRKLHLVADDLRVDSFSTWSGDDARGTVHGQAKPAPRTVSGFPQCCNYPTNPDFDCTFGCQTPGAPLCGPIEPIDPTV